MLTIVDGRVVFQFDKPTPSLCDGCKHAYIMPGGSIGIGDKNYQQRYCSVPGAASEITKDGRTFHVGIGTRGFDECSKYEMKEENANSEV